MRPNHWDNPDPTLIRWPTNTWFQERRRYVASQLPATKGEETQGSRGTELTNARESDKEVPTSDYANKRYNEIFNSNRDASVDDRFLDKRYSEELQLPQTLAYHTSPEWPGDRRPK